MVPLCVVEVHSLQELARLRGIVVLDRRFEPLARRCPLTHLTAQPAEQRNGCRRGHSCFCQISSRWSATKPSRSYNCSAPVGLVESTFNPTRSAPRSAY